MEQKFLYLSVALAMFWSCNRLPYGADDGNVPLSITMSTLSVKSLVTGEHLPDASEVGVALFSDDGGSYGGQSCTNVRYVASGTGSGQTWDSDTPVLLSSATGTLYAYYPYSAGITDISSIPVDASQQVDWMYGVPVPSLSRDSPDAAVRLRHALSAVRLSFVRGTYADAGVVSSVSIRGYGAAASAVLNARTGVLSSFSGAGDRLESGMSAFTLSSSPQPVDILAVPNGTSAVLEITVVIDGKEFTVATPARALQSGQLVTYPVTVNTTALNVGSVVIDGWEEISAGGIELASGYTVNITGDISHIRLTKWMSDGKLVVSATPASSGHVVNRAAVTGNVTAVQDVETDAGIRTIYLSDIGSDVTLRFHDTESLAPKLMIQHIDGKLHSKEAWESGGYKAAEANGLAVFMDGHVFVLHLSASHNSLDWGNAPTTGIPYVTDETSAAADVDGKGHTALLMEANPNSTDHMAGFCTSTIFPNGEHGYFPASGEMWAVLSQYEDVNTIVKAVTGSIDDRVSEYGMYSTSTLYSKGYTAVYDSFTSTTFDSVFRLISKITTAWTGIVIPVCEL